MKFEEYWEQKGHFGSNPEDVARLAWDAAVSEIMHLVDSLLSDAEPK